MSRTYVGPTTIECVNACQVPAGAEMTAMPRPRHNWGGMIHCPHEEDGCMRSFLVTKTEPKEKPVPEEFPDRNLDVLRERTASMTVGHTSLTGDDPHVGFVQMPVEPPNQEYLAIQVTEQGRVYKTWYPCDEGWVDAPPEDLEPDDFTDASSWAHLIHDTIGQRLNLRVEARPRPHVAAQEDDGDTD